MAREYPGYVAAAFVGHSTTVTHKHYWQVTDEEFERAIQDSLNPTQHLHARPRTERQSV